MTAVDILINNYNYEQYIAEAIESVLAQTHRDWRLLIVDDGSQDGSRAIIRKYASSDARIVPIFKENGGQLSAINAGYAHSSAKFLFFLDADDRYHAEYVERALQIYAQEPTCDFLFVAQQFIGSDNHINILADTGSKLRDFGYTAHITACSSLWVGERTSAQSLRRSLADLMFPITLEKDWRLEADNCIVWMSSIYGGRKFYLPEPLVDYRVHANNLWYGKQKSEHAEHGFQLAIERFFAQVRLHHPHLYSHKFGPDAFGHALHHEAKTGNKPSWLLQRYVPVIDHIGLGPFKRHKLRLRFKRLIKKSMSRRFNHPA